jgi:ABC-type sulfate transport system permease subunit
LGNRQLFQIIYRKTPGIVLFKAGPNCMCLGKTFPSQGDIYWLYQLGIPGIILTSFSVFSIFLVRELAPQIVMRNKLIDTYETVVAIMKKDN